MQTSTNQTTFKIVNPNGASVAPATPSIPLMPNTVSPTQRAIESLPKAAGTNVSQFNLLAAIDKAATPSATQAIQHSLPSTTTWALPDVSHLPPQATPAAIVPHDWLSGLVAWFQHLLPTLNLSHLPLLLSTWLNGLGPWLLGALGVFALNTLLHKLIGSFAPRTRGAAEYASYTLSDEALARAQHQGVTVMVVGTDENGQKQVNVPRWHLGAARRAGLKGH